jgi:hypothetical protein
MNQGISASRDIGSTIQFENHKVERWTGDQDFPASYAHGTWGRVAGFFQLPGVVTSSQQGGVCATASISRPTRQP